MILLSAAWIARSWAINIEPAELVGTWQIQLDVATFAKVPVLGETTITSRQIMVANVEESAGKLWVNHDTCSLAARTKPALALTEFPEAFINAIPDKSYPMELSDRNGVQRVRLDLGTLAIGFDAAVSAFPPSKLDHPAVVDWDKDGKPAATIHLIVPIFGTIEVYQAQSAHAIMDGVVLSRDRMEGGARVVDFHQRTLSASNRLFVQNPTLANDPSRSSFSLTRIEAGTPCSKIPPASFE